LFERRKRRLVPTQEAYTLLRNVEQALDALEEVNRSATELARAHSGSIRVACIPSVGTGFIPKAVANFRKIHPDTKVTLYVRTAKYVIEHVSGMRADIGLVSESVDQPAIQAELFQSPFGALAILPANHHLRSKRLLQPEDFEGENFISIGRDNPFRYLIDRAFVDAGVTRNVVVEASHVATAAALVAEGAGITVLDPYTAVSCCKQESVVLRPFQPEIKFEVKLLSPSNQPVPLIVQEFLQHLGTEHNSMKKLIKELISKDL
jgi:DNA-binding transcriptional LysR family regulator